MLQVISTNTLCGLYDVSLEEVPKVWSAWSALEFLNHIARFLIAIAHNVRLL